MEVFQRAEASTFFGREIGIMYTHAHLRYAEALARFGDAAGLLRALALANPIGDDGAGSRPHDPGSRPRYYSSSDAAFADRYAAAAAGYGGVHRRRPSRSRAAGGSTPRVRASSSASSSSASWAIRRRGPWLEIDPVLDPALDGTSATVTVLGGPLHVTYRTGTTGCGVRRVLLGDSEIAGRALDNPYRAGGLALAVDDLLAARAAPTDTLHLTVETL